MKTKETSTYKTKGLEFYITNAVSKSHAVKSFIQYRIGVTENDIELFEGKIPENASVMPAIEVSTREKALAWWNNLPQGTFYEENTKNGFCEKYYSNRTSLSLTGREIEEIWIKETGGELATGGEKLIEFMGYNKPNQKPFSLEPEKHQIVDFEPKKNQKQFKQFDESLFKAYIDKFSNEDKLKMLAKLSCEISTVNPILNDLLNRISCYGGNK